MGLFALEQRQVALVALLEQGDLGLERTDSVESPLDVHDLVGHRSVVLRWPLGPPLLTVHSYLQDLLEGDRGLLPYVCLQVLIHLKSCSDLLIILT